jgi:hypothetical protein
LKWMWAAWPRPAALLASAALLGGCAQAPKTLYSWETFPRLQYEHLAGRSGSVADQILAMDAHAAKARAAGQAVPPGFRAHLGLLQLAAGSPDQARGLFEAEKAAFPESAAYMDQLLRRLDAQATAPHTPKPWRLSVAPMMDWTDRHCRVLHRLITRHTRLYTEMVTTGALLHGDVPRHLDFNAAEHPVALQLGGSEPADLAPARGWPSAGATTRSTSTAAAPASGCSAAPSAPA